MQSRDKEKDINWNYSQFSGRDLIGQKAAGCGCVILQKNGDMHVRAHAQLRHLDKNKRSCEKSLAESEGKTDVGALQLACHPLQAVMSAGGFV